MRRTVQKVRAALALGVLNIIHVGLYRIGVRTGLNPVRRLVAEKPLGPFFKSVSCCSDSGGGNVRYPNLLQMRLFSYLQISLPIDSTMWTANPLTGKCREKPELPWWQIPDFDPDVGDIKLIWELSRFDWVLAFALAVRGGDRDALVQLNNLLADWCDKNRPYLGPNWKCGQEASIRVMHLAMAAVLLDQVEKPSQGLLELIRLHLQRIAPTIRYAMAQDNNHGTSEAAALFIGGAWLAKQGDRQGVKWAKKGRRWLENRAARLIGEQGSFSQYSLNYHRVMLDTFSMVEVWRLHLDLPVFSERWCDRALSATSWLNHMICPQNGDGPNVGANDGARVLQLSDTPYRDHRPSVQLAMALFGDCWAYPEGPWNDPLRWLGVKLPTKPTVPVGNLVADDGGFAVLRQGNVVVMLRYPRFRFRPSQADALHLDMWLDGENLLRDAGTYSYNTDPALMNYFGGTAGHNTVQFDERDQMPRLSRFLYGDWLKARNLETLVEDANGLHFGVGYRDGCGSLHHRRVHLSSDVLRVDDEIGGFSNKAVLRWRLAPGDWQLAEENGRWHVRSTISGISLQVSASIPIIRCSLVEGWESRHYLEKTLLPVMEVEVAAAGTMHTEVRWTK